MNYTESEWTIVGFTEGNGTTTEPQSYSFYDDVSSLSASSFTYRLKQVDYDGSYEYSEEIVIENLSTLPKEFALSQNYPNPFNPATNIEFKLPVKSFVLLVVYDVLGNIVATLVNEEKPAGTHATDFNASKLTSGIYIYTIKAGSFVDTKKMVLMK